MEKRKLLESDDTQRPRLSIARQEHRAVARHLRQCLLDDPALSPTDGLPVPDLLDLIAAYTIDRSVTTLVTTDDDDLFQSSEAYSADAVIVSSEKHLSRLEVGTGKITRLLEWDDRHHRTMHVYRPESIYLTKINRADPLPSVTVVSKYANGVITVVGELESYHPFGHRLIVLRNTLYDVSTSGMFTEVSNRHAQLELKKSVSAIVKSRHPADAGKEVLFIVSDDGYDLLRVSCADDIGEPIPRKRIGSLRPIKSTFVRRFYGYTIEEIVCTPSGHIIVSVECLNQATELGDQLFFCDPYAKPTDGDGVQLLAGLCLKDTPKPVSIEGHPLHEIEFGDVRSMAVNDTDRCLIVVEPTLIRKVPLDEHFFIPLAVCEPVVLS